MRSLPGQEIGVFRIFLPVEFQRLLPLSPVLKFDLGGKYTPTDNFP